MDEREGGEKDQSEAVSRTPSPDKTCNNWATCGGSLAQADASPPPAAHTHTHGDVHGTGLREKHAAPAQPKAVSSGTAGGVGLCEGGGTDQRAQRPSDTALLRMH